MTATSPTRPQSASAPRAPDADTKVRRLSFAFPFLKKGVHPSDAATQFTDEHEIYQLLAEREPTGSYLVSSKGMWHGGIHITDTGAGTTLDLNQGVRCIADGHLIAYRINRTYPVSELPAMNGQPATQVPYSTGFALVRHTLEFPKGTMLTFYSLYLHLQAFEEYERQTGMSKPAYWSTRWKITECARDRPKVDRSGQTADAGQQGLNVRANAHAGRRGEVIAILPQGAQVTLERKGNWGKVTDTHGARLYARQAGTVAPASAVGGWIFLGNEHGGPVATEFMPDDVFDRVVVTVPAQADINNAGSQGVPIKAGDLIGHLGRYDSLNPTQSSTRMAHIEVFCDENIKSFIEKGRQWVEAHGAHKEDWAPMGLSSEPTLLRVDRQVKLYQAAEREGADAPKTGVVQRWSLAELSRDRSFRHTEANADRTGRKVNWWRVSSADATRRPIIGWVREEGFAGGRVTREFAQKWVDFLLIDEPHDSTHTIFETTRAWVDYAGHADVPDVKTESKLSPLMKRVYRALFAEGDGDRAADDLCNAFKGSAQEYPWSMLAASRLIVKHESEWANPDKWKQLYAEIERAAGPNPQFEEEQKRIEKLIWWDEVKAKVPGFPGAYVFHIHPIGLIGNFQSQPDLISLELLLAAAPENTREYYQTILDPMNKYAKLYSVNTPRRIAHFLSQMAHESSFRAVEESLRYSPKHMRKTFGCKGGERRYDANCDDCTMGRLRDKLWAQSDYYALNPEHLANYVYANRMGNGDEESGDGYRYRGRGFIQTTGRDNYKAFMDEHNRRSPDDLKDFVENPDALSNLNHAVESAYVYWYQNSLNAIADNGGVIDVTQRVNGGQKGFADRLSRFNRIAQLLNVSTE